MGGLPCFYILPNSPVVFSTKKADNSSVPPVPLSTKKIVNFDSPKPGFGAGSI